MQVLVMTLCFTAVLFAIVTYARLGAIETQSFLTFSTED